MPIPEEQARELIDAQLEASGWVIQDRSQMNCKALLGVAVREYPMATEYFDAHIIGLTATPSVHKLGFFQQNLVAESDHSDFLIGGLNLH